MKPRKLTKTMKDQIARRKQIANLKRQMTIDHKKSIATTPLIKTSVCAELYSTKHIPSLDSGKHNTVKSSIMAERYKESPEVRAEIERKANSLAPAYSKGAYQYIASEEAAKCAGRKNV